MQRRIISADRHRLTREGPQMNGRARRNKWIGDRLCAFDCAQRRQIVQGIVGAIAMRHWAAKAIGLKTIDRYRHSLVWLALNELRQLLNKLVGFDDRIQVTTASHNHFVAIRQVVF